MLEISPVLVDLNELEIGFNEEVLAWTAIVEISIFCLDLFLN